MFRGREDVFWGQGVCVEQHHPPMRVELVIHSELASRVIIKPSVFGAN